MNVSCMLVTIMRSENIHLSIALQSLVIERYANMEDEFPPSKLQTCNQVHVVSIALLVLHYQVIGDSNLIMGSCHIAHDCKLGNNNIFANNTLLAGHVLVEVSSFFLSYN